MNKHESMLIKVRGLLAKAADPNIDPREADLFRQKADELMVKYTIGQWQIKKADDNNRDIVSREYDFSWFTGGGEHSSSLWSIMLSVARHCRVKVINWEPDWSGGKIPIVGVESDMDWFDLLFTNIMTDFVAGLEPRPNHSLSFAENIANLKDAGMKWQRIVELLWNEGMISHEKYPKMPTMTQIKNMYLAGVYNKFCEQTGRPRLRIQPSVYRRSYSLGYDAKLRDRLSEMRRRTERSEGQGSGMELVLADIYTRVKARAEELFPREETTRRRSRTVSRELKVSRAAMADGAARAERVNLSASKHSIHGQKEIES